MYPRVATDTHVPVTAEMLARLSKRGPRYTSYPTALHFHEGVGGEDIRAAITGDDTAAERPLSLYFHVLYCRKLCWYCACTREVSRKTGASRAYTDMLLAEIDLKAPMLAGRPVTQIHLGGGTPTFLDPEDLERLIGHVRQRLDVAEDAEISIEIDPRECTQAHIDAMVRAGFTRASLGVQDTDPTVQKAINRVQPFAQTKWCVDALRTAGITHINLDLIYGLPKQTLDTIDQTLRDVLSLDPDRLAIYGYAHVPWVHPAQRLLERHAMPDADDRLAMLTRIIHTLEEAAYVHIGMDHFARPEDSLARALDEGTLQRNFQGYSTRGGVDIHGFGPSAISATPEFYAQNHKERAEWEQALASSDLPVARGVFCDEEDQTRRHIIMELMCKRAIDLNDLASACGVDDFSGRFAEELRELARYQRDGLVHMQGDSVEVTQLGRHFLRNLAMCFDGYLSDERRYSKTV